MKTTWLNSKRCWKINYVNWERVNDPFPLLENYMQLYHLIFDIETMGKKETTIIPAMAVTYFRFDEPPNFDLYFNRTLSIKLDCIQQAKDGRTKDKNTMDWWAKQPLAVRQAVFGVDETTFKDIKKGLQKIAHYIKSTPVDFRNSYAFSRGSNYDFPKIEDIFDQYGVPLPYNYWKVRDGKTYVDIMAGVDDAQYTPRANLPNEILSRKHDPRIDVALDAVRMTELYQQSVDAELYQQ